MIITRTPLRVSFAGGGTDLPSYYRAHGGGSVVSAAIDRYIYVLVNEKFDQDIRVSYSRAAEYVSRVDDIKHPAVREALRMTGVDGSVEIVTISDIPAEGTGIGSSSAFAVGILNALWAFKGELKGPGELAEAACELEIGRLKETIGKQDQYAAAFGGLHQYEFRPDDSVGVHALPLSREERERFEQHFALYYTGVTRSAGKVLQEQDRRTGTGENLAALDRIREMSGETRKAILARDFERVGRLLDEAWTLKKGLANGITNSVLDRMYSAVMAAGAWGGKVTGAGGGGFLLVAAPREKRVQVEQALSGHRHLPVHISTEGSRIVFVGR
ncbi:MAG: GHMP kinase [Euryarchaeota archaeon]|nr:GHMP kinase [Euryarchaeota archaeon]MDE1835814.1 GHMP kinase [Euryarchaeota archaeon]MDE1880712.1 GHMP kinase [Euryarchaeota archaeon]MDE2044005.1 GHMP kinase [Thermoplasmata archaeon]